jgi:P27 family predicted phage terminase small subunit
MGSRGPARTPTAIRMLHGEARPSQVGRDEPRPGGALRMPSGLPPDVRKVWRRVVAAQAPGVLTTADVFILEDFCFVAARLHKNSILYAGMSPIVRGPRGQVVKNALAQVVRDDSATMARLASQLGLSPASRVGLSVRETPTGDPLERFLG